jgi:hypothetical protein
MTTTNEQKIYSVTAIEDLSAQATRYRAITLAGALMAANAAAGASTRVAGILVTSTRSGEQASYVYDGITKAVAGAAIATLGYPIMPGSSGYVFAAASGAVHCGRALELANSGDMVQVMVDFKTLPAWAGV